MEKLIVITIFFGLICMAYSQPAKADQFKSVYDKLNEIEALLSDATEDDYMMDDMFDDEATTDNMNDPQNGGYTTGIEQAAASTSWMNHYNFGGSNYNGRK